MLARYDPRRLDESQLLARIAQAARRIAREPDGGSAASARAPDVEADVASARAARRKPIRRPPTRARIVPALKSVDNGSETDRIVLEGSDVTTATGRAVVVAVGAGTRLGALAAVLAEGSNAATPYTIASPRSCGARCP